MGAGDGVAFLQWALPKLGFRWAGFRKPRNQVLKRVRGRARELGVDGLDGYRAYLEAHPEEWSHLESLCRVTISRFYRDRWIFDRLRDTVLPALAQHAPTIRCWSAGCASGEEPYTLALIDHLAPVGAPLSILATDADEHLLERARRARYPRGALKGLPDGWIEAAFEPEDDELRLERAVAERVRFERHDLRRDPWPEGPFELILCRNLAFTYFDAAGQREALDDFADRLVAGGALVVGSHERPPDDPRLTPWTRRLASGPRRHARSFRPSLGGGGGRVARRGHPPVRGTCAARGPARSRGRRRRRARARNPARRPRPPVRRPRGDAPAAAR